MTEILLVQNQHLHDNKGVNSTEPIMAKYKWYQINTNILPSKLAYFFETARRIGYAPNLVLFLTGIGLSKSESGFIVGFRFLGMMLGGPFWGMIADKWHCHRIVITIMCLTTVLFMCSQPFVSLQHGNPKLNICPNPSFGSNNTMVTVTTNCTSFNCSNSQNSSSVSSSVFQKNNADTDGKTSVLFLVMFLINFGVSFSEGSAVAFVDTATIRRTQLSPHRKIQYGRQRMWASLGGALGIVVTNLCIEYFPPANVNCYSAIFIVYSILTLFFATFTLLLYRGLSFKTPTNDNDDKNGNKKERLRKIFLKTIFRSDVAFFYLTTFISGLSYSQYTSFLYLYMKELDAPSILLSLAIVVSGTSSVLGFAFSHSLIKFLGGTWKAIAFSFLVYFVRYLGIALIQNPWLVLIFQSLHSISATLFVAASVNHLKETSPLPIVTTLVASFNSIHYGVGTIVGSSISGVVYEKFGGRTLFLSSAILGLCWAIVVVAYIVLCQNKKSMKKIALQEKE